jgi:5-keto 4-deoxyuronate isomerase
MADKWPNAPTKTSVAPKPKGNPAVPKGRTYKFALPYQLSGIEAAVGVGRLQEGGVWDQIPADLREQMENLGYFSTLTITKQDLDRIPTPAWTQIAQMLGLEWK